MNSDGGTGAEAAARADVGATKKLVNSGGKAGAGAEVEGAGPGPGAGARAGAGATGKLVNGCGGEGA